jgi:hypothetical protein
MFSFNAMLNINLHKPLSTFINHNQNPLPRTIKPQRQSIPQAPAHNVAAFTQLFFQQIPAVKPAPGKQTPRILPQHYLAAV